MDPPRDRRQALRIGRMAHRLAQQGRYRGTKPRN